MVPDLQLTSAGASQTRRLAAGVAAHLRPGDVVALTGDLGAGKTCFVQGAAAALGVAERVTSPSFVLRRDYGGRVPVVHLDLYRLDSMSEVLDLGLEEVLDAGHVTFVEWGGALGPVLPGGYLEVELRRDDTPLQDHEGEQAEGGVGEDTDEPRLLCLRGHGPGWEQRLAALRAQLSDPPAGGPA